MYRFQSLVRHQAQHAVRDACSTSNDYDGRLGIRISSIFVILVGSMLGAVFPVFAKRHRGLNVPGWAFFVAKYFGSGVIIATSFIHLLGPANEALSNPCLRGVITEYPWAEGIALMAIFLMFFLEIMAMRFGGFEDHSHDEAPLGPDMHTHTDSRPGIKKRKVSFDYRRSSRTRPIHETRHTSPLSPGNRSTKVTDTPELEAQGQAPAPGEDHLGHRRHHRENPTSSDWQEQGLTPERYAAQITGIFILEFGIIFHSIFIGLTLAVSGDEFITLYIVLVFHQTFEGLGLGARLATVPWPRSKAWTPYLMAFGFGVTTPIAIAIGLGVRNTYPPESTRTLLVNGVFDSISAGILIYTGLVELMAHEFMFSPYMQKGPLKRMLFAFLLMCLGAGLMALLGRWA